MIMLRILCLLTLSLVVQTGNAQELEIKLKVQNQGETVSVIFEKDPTIKNDSKIAEIEKIFMSDLGFSGHLKLQSNKKFTPTTSDRYKIRFQINEKSVEPYIKDSVTGKTMIIKPIERCGNWDVDRKQIHHLSDTIYRALTGKPGIASSRILFTYTDDAEVSLDNKSEIRMIEYNGQYTTCLLNETTLSIGPRFLYLNQKEAPAYLFVSYITGCPKIFLHNLNNNTIQKIISLKGNQLTPDISLQNDKIVFISDLRGNPDLFLQHFSPKKGPLGNPVQLLSSSFGTQGNPSLSPDGTHLAFVSNKEGSPKIYVMQIEPKLTKPHLLIKKYRESNCPAWSPDGTKIAFCAISKGVRQIYVYDMLTREDMQITSSSGHKESPAWAPDGEHLVFSGLSGKNFNLSIVNIVTKQLTKITGGSGDKRFPSWEQTFKTSTKRIS